MIYWTPKMVEKCLIEAVAAMGEREAKVPCPTVDGDGTQVALLWFLWLQPDDAQLLWMRVELRPWKEISRLCGISRATANRRVEYLLSVIAWKLNHQAVPRRWSCRYLVERTREVSRDA